MPASQGRLRHTCGTPAAVGRGGAVRGAEAGATACSASCQLGPIGRGPRRGWGGRVQKAGHSRARRVLLAS